MKIIFLGTSHGNPEPGRHNSCTMIQCGGSCYFIDMGMAAGDELVNRGIPYSAVKGIFITHMHCDHTNWLMTNWYCRPTPFPIYLPDLQGGELIKQWLAINGLGGRAKSLDFRPVEEGLLFDDGNLRLTAIPTLHNERSFAYFAEGEGKRVLFTGDLAHKHQDFPQRYVDEGLDLLVAEAAHFAVTEYAPLLAGKPVKKVAIQHYVDWNIPHTQALARELAPVPVILTSDGLEIDV